MQPWRYAPQHLPRLLELLCRASTLQCGPPRHQPLLGFDREGTGVFAVSGKFLGQGHTKFIGGNSTCYRSYAISVGSAEWVAFVHPPAPGIQRRGSSWHVNFHMLSGLGHRTLKCGNFNPLQEPRQVRSSAVGYGAYRVAVNACAGAIVAALG